MCFLLFFNTLIEFYNSVGTGKSKCRIVFQCQYLSLGKERKEYLPVDENYPDDLTPVDDY